MVHTKNILFIFTLFLCNATNVISYAQAPSINWQKSLGGSGNDYAYCIQQTGDNGYIVTGSSNSNDYDVSGNHGDYDIWVVKLDDTGAIMWQKSLGGSGTDVSSCIQQTIDSGYIIAGSSKSIDGDVTQNHGGYDCWIIKLSSNGNIQWQKSFGGSADDNAYSVKQTSDSGYIIAGQSSSNDGDVTGHHGVSGSADFWVIKLSSSGSLQWQKCLGGTGNDNAICIQQTSDGGYVVTGDSYSNDGDVTGNHGGEDYWVVKLTPSGSIQWQKTFGGTGSDYAQSIVQTSDNGYIIAGGSNSNDMDVSGNVGMGDYWVVKLTSTGSLQWQKCLGGTKDDAANCVQVTSDGGYIVTGWVSSNDGDVTGFHGSDDYWVVKLSATGSVEWQKAMGSLGMDVAWYVLPTRDSGYIVAGYTFYSGGDVTFNYGHNDFWIVKLNDLANVFVVKKDLSIYLMPNPASSTISVIGAGNVKICVYNTSGSLVKEVDNSDHIYLSEFPPGMYLIRLFNKSGKMIKQEKIIKE